MSMDILECQQKYLTVKAFARRLGVTPGRVRQFICEGRLRTVMFGANRAIPEDEALRFERIPRPTGRPKSIA